MNEQAPDIFISYSSKDRAWVSGLANALEACGFNVWWDKDLLAGDNFYTEIEGMLDKAGCVVTVWSENSVKSEWVLPESKRGISRKAWVPVMYQPTSIPLAFDTRHHADLQAWRGDVNEECFQSLLRAIEKVLRRPAADVEHLPAQNFLSVTWKQSHSGINVKYLIIAAVLLCVVIIVGVTKLPNPSPSSVDIRGDCSGDFSGDITGANVTLDCSKKN